MLAWFIVGVSYVVGVACGLGFAALYILGAKYFASTLKLNE